MQTIGIIASGPSATIEDAAKLRAVCDQVITINDSYRLCKDADHLYGTDYRWWKWAFPDVMRDFEGKLWTQEVQWTENPEDWGINCLESDTRAKGLCTEPGKIHTGQNSGYAAINLAGHLLDWTGVIILLGYDMQMNGSQRHWFNDRPSNFNVDSCYPDFIKNFQTINPAEYGLEIWNCTRSTALKHFPQYDLDDVVMDLAA